jgi:hypothetical protein
MIHIFQADADLEMVRKALIKSKPGTYLAATRGPISTGSFGAPMCLGKMSTNSCILP